jgi:hypothetical protein
MRSVGKSGLAYSPIYYPDVTGLMEGSETGGVGAELVPPAAGTEIQAIHGVPYPLHLPFVPYQTTENDRRQMNSRLCLFSCSVDLGRALWRFILHWRPAELPYLSHSDGGER